MLVVLLSYSWTPGRPPVRRVTRSGRCVASAQPPPLESAAELLNRVMQLPEPSSELLPRGELLDEAEASVQHGDMLAERWMREQSLDEQLSMHFVRTFLSLSPYTQPAELFVTGGYVRDLLRGAGHHSDDLDLSICLRGCAGNVTITNLMGDLPAFALERPDLGVKEVPVWVAQVIPGEIPWYLSAAGMASPFGRAAGLVEPRGVTVARHCSPAASL